MEGSNVGTCNDCFFGFAISLKANAVNLCRSAIWSDVKITGCGLHSATVAMTSPALSNINMPGSCNEKKKYMKMCAPEPSVLLNAYVDSQKARPKDYQTVYEKQSPKKSTLQCRVIYIDHGKLNYIYQVMCDWLFDITRGKWYQYLRNKKTSFWQEWMLVQKERKMLCFV